MDELRTLAQRLRDKESRDNRALLDEAADAIEQLTEDKSCAWCRGGKKIMLGPTDSNTAEIVLYPVPHLRVTVGGEAVGIAINSCPRCGRRLIEEVSGR